MKKIFVLNSFAKINIFIFFITIFANCLYIPKIEDFNVSNISIGVSKMKMTMNVNVDIKNDNFFKVKLENINLNIYLNDNYLTTLTDSSLYVLHSNTTTTITFPVTLKYNEISENVGSFLSIVLGEKATLKVEGTIDYKALLIERKININTTTQIN